MLEAAWPFSVYKTISAASPPAQANRTDPRDPQVSRRAHRKPRFRVTDIKQRKLAASLTSLLCNNGLATPPDAFRSRRTPPDLASGPSRVRSGGVDGCNDPSEPPGDTICVLKASHGHICAVRVGGNIAFGQ